MRLHGDRRAGSVDRGMSSIVATGLAYAHPGGDLLFSDVSFKVAPGDHAALVGANGVGKSTLLRCLAGDLPLDEGEVALGARHVLMRQDVGLDGDVRTVREPLLDLAPGGLRARGRRCSRPSATSTPAPTRPRPGWPRRGDRHLVRAGRLRARGPWDAAARAIVGAGFDEVGDRAAPPSCPAASASSWSSSALHGRRRRPAARRARQLPRRAGQAPPGAAHRASPKTILLVSHDRELLANATRTTVTLEGAGAWVHGGSYATYPEARAHRQELLGDALQRWKDEERRLFRYFKLLKERARYAPDFAKKADAAESRWERFVAAGPPPRPSSTSTSGSACAAPTARRRVLDLRAVALPGLVRPFSDEVHFGERLGSSGPTARARRTSCGCSPGTRSSTRARSSSARASRPGTSPSSTRATTWPGRSCSTSSSLAWARPGRHGGAGPLRAGRRRAPRPSRRSRAARRRAWRSSASRSRATTCCSSTSPRTTSTSTAPTPSSRPSTASRARSSPSPTTATSCAAWTASGSLDREGDVTVLPDARAALEAVATDGRVAAPRAAGSRPALRR